MFEHETQIVVHRKIQLKTKIVLTTPNQSTRCKFHIRSVKREIGKFRSRWELLCSQLLTAVVVDDLLNIDTEKVDI